MTATITPRTLTALLLTGALAGCATESAPGERWPVPTDPVVAAMCPPQDLFGAALCLCDDFNDVGVLKVYPGPSGPGSVGVNGYTRFINYARVEGDWAAYGGFDAIAAADIDGTLASHGDARWTGNLSVGGDLAVGGDALGIGYLVVQGALRVAGVETMLGVAEVGSRGAYTAPDGPPCACDPGDFFDVVGAVDAARNLNDNATIGLPTDLTNIGVSVVALPSGRYFLGSSRSIGLTRLRIEGDVSLFIDGSLDTIGDDHIEIADGASLDLFVSGSVRTIGHLHAGNANDPSAFDLYIGGTEPLSLSIGLQQWYGAIYAPTAEIAYVGDTHIVGSLFADTVHGIGRLTIGYGADTEPPSSCDPPPDEPDDDGGNDNDPGPVL